MKRISQLCKIGLALFLAVFANGLLPAVQASAYSMTNPNGDYKKVYVCKYVGTPGTDERLQTGDNPISVSTNAISGFSGIGSYFNDAHGRSYVVAWDNGDKIEPPLSMCPAPDGPDSISVPATPSVDDPCGPRNATWIVPADTAQIDWTLKPNGDLVADTKTGYIFADQTITHNFGKATDSNTPCGPVVIPVPATPSVNDPCGIRNATWIVPADTAQIDWTLEANGDLVAETKAGYEFATGNKTSHNFSKAIDSGELCPPDEIPVPATPEVKDPCGIRNATWIVPADTTQIDWTLEANGDLVARTKDGYIFANESTSHNYGNATDSGELCPPEEIPVPATPGVKDPCGLDNASWKVPENTNTISWTLEENGDLIAHANKGYIFSDEATTHNYGQAVDSGKLCVTICHRTAATNNPYNRISVDEHAVDGVGRGDHLKKHTGPIYYDGIEGKWGDIIPAIGDNEGLNWTTRGQFILDETEDCDVPAESTSKWIVEPCLVNTNSTDVVKVEITNTDDDTDAAITYTVTVGGLTKTITLADGATGTLSFSGVPAGTQSATITGTDGTDIQQSVIVKACTFSGQIGGAGASTTVTATTAVLPASIPATGPAETTNPFLAILAAITAYGATFFFQQRRNLRNEAAQK